MIKQFYLVLLTITFFGSCKKDTTEPTADDSPTTAAAPSSTGVVIPAGLTLSSNGNQSVFQTEKIYTESNGVITKDSSIFVAFYSQPQNTLTPAYVYGGTVTLNNKIITPDTAQVYYFEYNSSVNITSPLSWSVTGSGTVTAFNQNFTPSYPRYTGTNVLPDTCIKSDGITLNITGVSNNAGSICVYLYSGGSLASNSPYKILAASGGTVNFTPADLNGLSLNQQMTINVQLVNNFSAVQNGIKNGFVNYSNYKKLSYLK
ncbi:MAG: hypothetical protein ACXVC7_04315 [Bacteroidia bacterium]